jgi:hypothetical protein
VGRAFSAGFRPRFEKDGRLLIGELFDEQLREAGLLEGDEVLSLDGKPVGRLERPALWRYWLSPEPFSFSIDARRGDRTLRARAESVPRRFSTMDWTLRGSTAYLRIRWFAAQSLIELRRALREIEKARAGGLVIDLRQDGGGVLSPGLVDCFLKPGTKLVTYEEMRPGSKPQDIEATVEYHDLPVAVLVDGQTASMGEAFAAAIQVNRRGTLIGQTTFGKGVGQSRHDVGVDGTLWLVDRFYYYPGRIGPGTGAGSSPMSSWTSPRKSASASRPSWRRRSSTCRASGPTTRRSARRSRHWRKSHEDAPAARDDRTAHRGLDASTRGRTGNCPSRRSRSWPRPRRSSTRPGRSTTRTRSA